jgi:hypothetical protein
LQLGEKLRWARTESEDTLKEKPEKGGSKGKEGKESQRSKPAKAQERTKKPAGHQECPAGSVLEHKLHSKLYEPWIIVGSGAGDLSKAVAASRKITRARETELGMVEEVEELGPELEVGALGDAGLLEEGEIKVIDSGRPQGGIDARLRTVAPRWRCSEAAGVKPIIELAE